MRRVVDATGGLGKEARSRAAQASSAPADIPQALHKSLARRPEHTMLMEALVFSWAFYGAETGGP